MEKPEELFISEIRFRVPGQDDLAFENVSNYTTISELKEMMNNQSGGGYSMRLFFGGRELKEGLAIYNYQITSDITLTCVLRKTSGGQ